MIGLNMYRLKDGRFEQVGMSWLKHGFYALSNELCDTGCISTNGWHLGVNCADPYSASLNGAHERLAPRYEINPYSGDFPFPGSMQSQTGNSIYKDSIGKPISSRVRRPMARPNSKGRPGPSPRQNGIFPGSPGAGVTSTRSLVH